MEKAHESKNFDFKVIGDPLNKLLVALGNKLSREWPAKYRHVTGARELFVIHLRTARQLYLSALYLCGDVPTDPRRKPEFCVSLAPINRSLLDVLFTIIFILEDLPSRCQWFNEAGWRETRLELDRYIAEYGSRPEWNEWLSELERFATIGIGIANLSPAQAANPKALRSWPNPGAMWRCGIASTDPLPSVRAFLKYLDDYFYIDLSQQSHLTAWGMIKRSGFLVDEIHELPSTEEQIKKERYSQIQQSVAFVLALASEIEAHFSFGLRNDTLYAWNVAAPLIVIVDEVYKKRYRELLGAE